MKAPYFEVVIENGKMMIEGHGFVDGICEDLVQVLEGAGKAGERRRKPEEQASGGRQAERRRIAE